MRTTVTQHVRQIMHGSGWWTPTEIQTALEGRGVYCTSFMERVRDLRKSGHVVECKPMPGRRKGSHVHVYRLVRKE